MYEKYPEVSRKYGPYARIGPNTLLTNNLQLLRSMSAARSPYGRSNYYAGLQMDSRGESILSMTNTADHDALRAKMATAFAGKENDSLESDIDSQIMELVTLLRCKYLSTDTYTKLADLGDIIIYFAMDAVSKIAYGESFGYLRRDEDVHKYLTTFRQAAKLITIATDVPALRVGNKIVSQRYHSGEDKRDMLGGMKRHGLTKLQAEIETITTLMAGAETTSTAVRTGLLYLITSPVILQNLRLELRRNGHLDSPDDQCISKADADKLPYLQACIKEILRMNPPFAGMLEKAVPDGGDYINGHYVPGGTGIAHSTFSLQRDTEIFGHDPEIFRPERWIQASPEQLRTMNDAVDMVFGYGRWGCIGRPIAYIELSKIFVESLDANDDRDSYYGDLILLLLTQGALGGCTAETFSL
ncbi:hypothetical protein EYZ11_011329 [Aspergillus tanneri]|uniref:Uncharacterized protein n=1 Tax=Aspergillus tanneri TaxID=1220188 RepID=A0A4S3J318_9EURO|nr:hypothetical protein EYZ11_011329 [Aspergillus tanneri]